MVFLTMVANYLKEARGDPAQIAFGMEQPATLKEYMPEIVSFWDTKEWPAPKKEFGWKEVTFHQGAMGGAATKPTTFGGNLDLELNKHKRFKEGKDKGEIKTSKDLSRWAPGVMSMVAEALMVQVMRQEPNLRPLSWDEQLTAILHTGGTVQSANRQCSSATHIEKVPHPIGGVLSLDVAGPLVPAKDIGRLCPLDAGRNPDMGRSSPVGSDRLKDPEVPDTWRRTSI